MQNKALSLWQLSAMQLLKDCGKEIREDEIYHVTSKADLTNLAQRILTLLIEDGGNTFSNALYRLDLNEGYIRKKLQGESPEDKLRTLAASAADRCIRKVETRRYFSF